MRIYHPQFIYHSPIVIFFGNLNITDSIRNHAVLNIAVEESRLFLTKERAPFMICIELYRPEELKLAL